MATNPTGVPSIASPLVDPATGRLTQPWYQFLVGLQGSLGGSITFDTAPPTRGTWAQGSVRFNSVATVGHPKGWVCTVAGAPGTWVSMGNL